MIKTVNVNLFLQYNMPTFYRLICHKYNFYCLFKDLNYYSSQIAEETLTKTEYFSVNLGVMCYSLLQYPLVSEINIYPCGIPSSEIPFSPLP